MERDGLRLVCVTLGDPNDWNDHAALYDWACSRWKWERLDAAVDGLTVPVISGESERVGVRAAVSLAALLPRDRYAQAFGCRRRSGRPASGAAAPVRAATMLARAGDGAEVALPNARPG